jgi:threonine 3-dehydrogenase
VLITGAGPIGCMAVPIAKMAGARKIVITDVNPYRLDIARKMGATLAIDVRETKLQDAMHDLGMKEGFDIGLEMSGNPRAFTDMLDVMVNGGRIAMLGIMPGSAAIDWNLVVFHGLTIKGIYGREMFETWYKMTSLIQSGLDISPVITHHFPYTKVIEGIELMKSGQSVRSCSTGKRQRKDRRSWRERKRRACIAECGGKPAAHRRALARTRSALRERNRHNADALRSH